MVSVGVSLTGESGEVGFTSDVESSAFSPVATSVFSPVESVGFMRLSSPDFSVAAEVSSLTVTPVFSSGVTIVESYMKIVNKI